VIDLNGRPESLNHLRRKEKQVTDQAVLVRMLSSEAVMRLAVNSDGQPYIVPVNFGYRDNALYFHSAKEGMKIEALKQNPRVCFEVERGSEVLQAQTACGFGTRYRSIIGYGVARILESAEEKKYALSVMMEKYATGNSASGMPAHAGTWDFDREKLDRTLCVRIDIESMTGKQSGAWGEGAR